MTRQQKTAEKPGIHKSISRREFMRTTGVGVMAGLGCNFITPGKILADNKKLKILQWSHFVSPFDDWFDNTYVKEWGKKHDTQVIVDHISYAQLKYKAVAEVMAQEGHDLFMFVDPPPALEAQVIDHREVYQKCEELYGKPVPFALKSTYNPKTNKYFGFADSYSPDPINYRKDLWDDVGIYPDTWDDVLTGGAKIKKKHGIPVGIGLSKDIDSNMAMRAIMYSYGASVQDEEGNVVLNSKQTLEAVKFVRALFKEAMTPDVLYWDSAANNSFMLDGNGSLVVNAISISRTAEREKQYSDISKVIWLAKPPAGPVRRVGLEHIISIYVIWKFSKNIEGAMQFLVDYVGDSRKAFLANRFYNFPCFPDTIPDLKKLISKDPNADPTDKYKILEDVVDWTTNVGHPGYANAAIDEIFGKGVITTMFQKAAMGELSPEEAIRQAEKECIDIFSKWKDKGIV